ncbi:hypothetical protein PaG_01532 [Moesziomyces aphidis]|jgi:hypothetical protein|uniref:Uncharacterized protein n=1 Tax=Moesziomyces aphidis TaxID=84754 RepID=W3VR43_MOEAP|nr:hypothetical protein PaG_01532 [Moesziomyces aphidis]
MTLKSNFEEIPTLLAPPSYLDSTATDDQVSEKDLLHPRTNIAPRYTAWKLVLEAFIGTAYRAAPDDLDEEERRATALREVLCNVRLVSRLLYSVSMTLLRTRFFPEYLDAIRATVYSTNLSRQSLDHPCRETRVLDHYISYRINRRFLASQSSLLLNDDDAESDQRQVSQDLFKWLQPQTYIEDEIGKALDAGATPSNGVQFGDLLVRFQFTRASITLPFSVDAGSSRSAASAPTIVRKECVAVDRASNEPVFVTAHRLLDQLQSLVFVRKTQSGKAWYELVGRST